MIIISLFCHCKNVFMKHHYLKKKYFYSHSDMDDITDEDYAHAKRVCKDFEKKNQENILTYWGIARKFL